MGASDMMVSKGRTRAGRSACAAILVQVVLAAESLAASPPRAAVPEFRRLALAAAGGLPEAAGAIERAKASSVVIFLPGALGSRLMRDGEVIWGDGRVSAERLMLREGETAQAELLLSYGTAVRTEDIYGRSREKLAEVLAGTGEIRDFAYDWRIDIGSHADSLDALLRSDPSLVGKELFLIGHSMGGLIAWDWQSRHYRGRDRDELKVQRMLLLGSPLGGACEVIRMLADGYRPSPGAGKVETVIYHALFKAMRAAAFTFPGIFELLPPVGSQRLDDACLTSALEPPELAADYFDPGFWRSAAARAILKDAWNEPGWRGGEAAFFERLAQVLATARAFRERLDLRTLNVPAVLFFTPSRETVAHARIERGGLLRQSPTIRYRLQASGDGRVLKRSAGNPGRATPVALHRLSLAHGDLPRDPLFIDYLADEVRPSLEAVSALHLLAALDDLPTLFAAYRQRGGALVASADFVPFLSADLADRAMRLVGRLTDRLLAEAGVEEPYRAGRAAQRAGRHAAAVPLIESALRAPAGIDSFNEPFALNRLGYALLLERNYTAALPRLVAAAERVAAHPSRYVPYSAERANILSNLGVAYYHLGQCALSRRVLARASALGSETASRYLAFQCFPRGEP